ncbi:PIG-L deacetylase family protein [Candidatus Desulforudis audaxviator]|uniref:LmbE family protein n=1 Tax=Desulforudis audaxviator (strain MP104C) TaxID=477974 RepID=B1I6E1_DESAP|nr:PIG-L family deacetylase [Candidatus Desulforudis audaxviator]ACA60552.1 LmbE family protein [Candidatus Desulforudis audaxviator MP104C]
MKWWKRYQGKPALLVLGAIFYSGYRIFSRSVNTLSVRAIRLLEDVPAPQSTDRILVFAPHPDDETIAAGGYIYGARRAGAAVRMVLVTDGNRHGLKEHRYREFRNAAKILGVSPAELRFWGYPDGALYAHRGSLPERVRAELENFEPTVVVAAHPADRHPDHAVLGRVVGEELLGVSGAGHNVTGLFYLVHHPYYPQPKRIRPSSLLPPSAVLKSEERWQRFWLTAEGKEAKRAAVKEYRSQTRNPFLRPVLLGSIRDNELFSTTINNNVINANVFETEWPDKAGEGA